MEAKISEAELLKIHHENITVFRRIAAHVGALKKYGDKIGLNDAARATQQELEDMLASQSVIVERVGEKKTCAIFDMTVFEEDADIAKLSSSRIVSVEREATLPCGNVDRLLRHADGTITVVELKGKGSRRDHACGIGQALVYAACARETLGASEVRAALFVLGEFDPWIAQACETAGVSYFNIARSAEYLIDLYSSAAKVVG